MTWTAIVQDVKADDDPRNGVEVQIVFTDQVSQKYLKTMRYSIDATDDDIKNGIGVELKLLEHFDTVKRDYSALKGLTLTAKDFPDPIDPNP